MKNKINIAELLKDCKKGMELYSPLFGDCKFVKVHDYEAEIIVELETGATVSFLTDGRYYDYPNAECILFPKGKTTWEGFTPPCQFKDGDIVTCTNKNCTYTAIFKGMRDYNSFYHYVVLADNGYYFCRVNDWADFNKTCRLATEEEKQKLFDAIKAKGYKWNAETKTLEKLNKNKFDIANLKPFDKVLVRSSVHGKWGIDFFGFYTEGYYNTTGNFMYLQCIPYEGNEHLRGTTNDCDEYFKTWE